MDAHTEEMTVPAGKLRQLSSGKWYVRCRWCDEEARLDARNENEAYGMLHEWRLSMPRRKYHQRNWSRPRCAELWQDTTPTATDAAGSAGQPAAKRAILRPNLRWGVQQLKAEVVELKAEIRILKAEIVELKSGLKAVFDQHVASEAERDDVIKNLKQIVETLAAQVTSVPDDEL